MTLCAEENAPFCKDCVLLVWGDHTQFRLFNIGVGPNPIFFLPEADFKEDLDFFFFFGQLGLLVLPVSGSHEKYNVFG